MNYIFCRKLKPEIDDCQISAQFEDCPIEPVLSIRRIINLTSFLECFVASQENELEVKALKCWGS